MNYYNEWNPYAADWLRNLIDAGLIPPGYVDERSICDVQPEDLEGYTQCHFFCGIAGWCEALRLAAWPTDVPVWTGSCPCQSYSTAGKQLGMSDERDLWPAFNNLIQKCRPPVVFGEQVASAIRFGWLDRVYADLEAASYACGAAVLGAHSVGSPHIRQRLYWMADARCQQRGRRTYECRSDFHDQAERLQESTDDQRCGAIGRLGDSNGSTQARFRRDRLPLLREQDTDRPNDSMAWQDYELIACGDGKTRRLKSGLEPLVNGIPFRLADGRTGAAEASRAEILKGIGNAIVPHVAAEFVRCV